MEKYLEYKGVKYRIMEDSDPVNPRSNDNLGTIVLYRNRYVSGDREYNENREFEMALEASETVWDLEKQEQRWKIPTEQIRENGVTRRSIKKYLYLPVHIYVHSGVALATTPFGCKWDSGRAGYIYAEKAKLLKEWGWKCWTPKRKEHIIERLRGEVAEYHRYLNGEVYMYCMIDPCTNEEEYCGGYDSERDAEEAVKSTIDALVRAGEITQ